MQRAIGVKNAGVKYATDVGIAIKDYDVNTAAAREEYISSLMTIAKSIGDKLLDAQRDKEIALADAELQKQLTGNESAYSSAVQAANDAYTNTTTSEEASRKSQEQTALSTMNTKLSNELKNKDADIAAAEREYDQTVASLDAQYGSESSNGDTGAEGATRRSAIKTRDAQYYAARDTSWANTLSASINLGTTPWTVKAITAANAEAAHSVSRASAQAAHDAAMLDAIEDWQLSSRESLTDLLFTEGQSRETFNVATSNVYANWENGVGNLLGDKPEGTGYVPARGFGEGGVGTVGGTGVISTTGFQEGDEEPLDSEVESDDAGTPRPILPPSKGPIVWITQQQMLDLERQHGAEMVDRLRSSYRVRDPNVGWLPGDLINSLPNDLLLEQGLHRVTESHGSISELERRLENMVDTEAAKGEARRIGRAIANTFNKNSAWWRFPKPPVYYVDERNKRIYCYEWAWAFHDAFIHESSGETFTASVQSSITPDAKVHYWLKIRTKDGKHAIYVDDGFWVHDRRSGERRYIHTEKPMGGEYEYDWSGPLFDKPRDKVWAPPVYDFEGRFVLPENSLKGFWVDAAMYGP